MQTEIPVGSFVRYKYKGEYQYAQVAMYNNQLSLNQLSLLLMPETRLLRNVLPNEIIDCKWGKNETLLRKKR